VPGKKSEEVAREERRRKVAVNLLAGATYREIAEALDCSVGTVANDVKLILGRWKREQVTDTTDYIDLECRRLDLALNAIWPKVRDGNLMAIDRLLSIMNRRAKYQGYDKGGSISGGGGDGAIEIRFVSNVNDEKL